MNTLDDDASFFMEIYYTLANEFPFDLNDENEEVSVNPLNSSGQ